MSESGRGSVGRVTQLPVETAHEVLEVLDRVTRDNVIDLAEQRELRRAAMKNVDVSEDADSSVEVSMHFMRAADRGPRTEQILARQGICVSRSGIAYKRPVERRQIPGEVA